MMNFFLIHTNADELAEENKNYVELMTISENRMLKIR